MMEMIMVMEQFSEYAAYATTNLPLRGKPDAHQQQQGPLWNVNVLAAQEMYQWKVDVSIGMICIIC